MTSGTRSLDAPPGLQAGPTPAPRPPHDRLLAVGVHLAAATITANSQGCRRAQPSHSAPVVVPAGARAVRIDHSVHRHLVGRVVLSGHAAHHERLDIRWLDVGARFSAVAEMIGATLRVPLLTPWASVPHPLIQMPPVWAMDNSKLLAGRKSAEGG